METGKNDEIEIDFREIFVLLLSKLAVIVLIAFLGALIAFTYTKFMIPKTYTSKTQIYVMNNTSTSDVKQVSVGELQASNYLTNDYRMLCKSRPVLEKVIEELKLDMSVSGLASKISVSTPSDTRIITIAVTDTDPWMAKSIADAVREAAKIRIVEVIGVESVNDVETANVPDSPVGPNMKLNIMLGFILGAIIAVAVIVIRYLLDDTIKTPDDVEKYIGLSVLGSIPLSEAEARKKKKKKKSK